jgi:transcriptional regulator
MPDSDLLHGTLELLVLKPLSLEPMHGWGLSLRLREGSGDVFVVTQGSLYPALQRMLTRGWIKSTWATSENGRRARYYALTRAGEEQLARHTADWRRASGAVERVLRLSFQG